MVALCMLNYFRMYYGFVWPAWTLLRYDHLRKEASEFRPAKVDETAEPWRSALESPFLDYVHNYYKQGVGTVYGLSSQDGVVLVACIESHQYNPKNYWWGDLLYFFYFISSLFSWIVWIFRIRCNLLWCVWLDRACLCMLNRVFWLADFWIR